ncbi:MAG: MATE family efflux transporter [Bacteroidetes bacterium]|nr:MATE family efflux transporter [Bacteroidota bacterium]
MEKLPSNKHIWDVSYPIILAMLASNVINVTDTAFLGRVGEVELGASAIGGLFYVVILMLGVGFGSGAQILMARRNGEKAHGEIGEIMDHSIYFLIGMALFILLIIEFIAPALLGTMISSPAVYARTIEFLHFRIVGLIPAFLMVIFRSFYVAITRTRWITLTAIIAALVNVVLAYALIFGKVGLPAMGIAGAGLASTIAEGVAALVFIIITVTQKDLKPYHLFAFPKPRFSIIRKTLSISVFVMLQFFISLGAWFVFFMIVEKLGERPLAISNIIRSAYLMFMIPAMGFSITTNSLVSNTIGAGRKDLVIPLIRKITRISFFTTLGMVVLAICLAKPIISVFTSNADLVIHTLPSFYVLMVVMLFFAVTNVIFNGVSGTANTQIALAFEAITLVFYLFTAYMLAIYFRLPIHIVWFTEIVYFVCLGTLSILYLRFGNWRAKKI